MANRAKCVPVNVAGEFFVDSTCIDCDTCRQLAPSVFGETGESAYVHTQPATANDRRQALQALVCCPTGSIGSNGEVRPQVVMDDLPLLIEDLVYYCGFNSPKSYGGNSYFVRQASGNWLIDSPKFLPRLVKQFTDLGGIARIFLTHRDDVADANRYAKHFGSERIIHRDELASQPGSERVLDGETPIRLDDEFVALPTPGHTKGHCCLLFRNKYLFTGDHLAWDRHQHRLEAFHDYCWYSWARQIESMRRLATYDFEWVLPGHGQRVHLPAEEMQRQMYALVANMPSES